ncbi:NAD-P-binding protein [Mycena sanguinolenta]|nr:NAD-P-binding protein [Mycena sanguinolenta]
MSEKKTVLITGCSVGGIGWALAKEFHSQGFRVFATSRRLETMEDLAVIGIETLALDVAETDAIRKTKEEISTRTGGKLDILINNAQPTVNDSAVSDLDISALRDVYETNLFGPMCMVQHFLPLLISSKGCVVNNGSIAEIVSFTFNSAYNSSKAAMRSFSDTLRNELAPFDVRVVHLMTGTVKSSILKPYTFPDDSLYKSMEEPHRTRYIEQEKRAMPTAQFARIVVAETRKAAPRRVLWAGANAKLVWFGDTFLPKSVMDWVVADGIGMAKFKARLRD